MKRFFLAVRFLTIYPFGSDGDVTADDLAGSTVYYPLVGTLLGLLLYGSWQAARNVWPVFLASALAVALWVIVTAGLHLDGLMDTFDGLGIRGNLERRLEVMRDSRVGAFGAQAAVLAVFLKIAALSALAANPAHFAALILAPAAGRTAIVVMMSTCPYARTGEGLGRVFTEMTGARHLTLSLLLFLIVGTWVAGTTVALLVLSQAVLFLLLRAFILKNFGGVTGDILGAVCEVHELSVLLLAPLVWL